MTAMPAGRAAESGHGSRDWRPGADGSPGGLGSDAPGGHHATTPFWISIGVGGAALIGGSAFAISARSAYHDLDQDGCGVTKTCDDSEIDSMERKALFADILFGTAVAGAAAATYFWFSSHEEPPVVVTASPDSVALTFGGTF